MPSPAVSIPAEHHRTPDVEGVWRAYGEYLRQPPLLNVEWTDDETGARGWLVINSLTGGAAGGGTRMRLGLTQREVVYLAKTMELKFLFSGPPIGGAKAGIDFDPSDPRRPDVLRRWFAAISPYLRHCYGTGGDLNVDEVLDVIPCCSELGLSHPQEGIVRGHLGMGDDGLHAALGALDRGVRAPVCAPLGLSSTALPLADLVTGYGLARSIVHTYAARGETVRGKRVAVEGFGAVGGPCALYLSREGARIVGLCDRARALVAPDGLAAEEVERLVAGRVEKCIPPHPALLEGVGPEGVDSAPAELFVCAAASGTLDGPRLRRLRGNGVSVIACGANQPFAERELGATDVQRMADAEFTIIPDVVANCGMARAFSHLMQHPGDAEPDAVFTAVDRTISDAVSAITLRARHRTTGLLAATLAHALDGITRAKPGPA